MTNKPLKIKLITLPGRLSYPYLLTPDTGRPTSSNKFSADLLIPKADWAKVPSTPEEPSGKAFTEAVLAVGRSFFGKPALTLADFKIPMKDTDKADKIVDPAQKGCIMVKARSKQKPLLIGATKGSDGKFKELTEEEVRKYLFGGAWCRFVVTLYGYPQQGGGVACGLNLVQYWKEGEAFGQGRETMLSMVGDMDVPLEAGAENQVSDTTGLGAF